MGLMYMATEKYGAWVECPRINMQAGKVGWETVTKFLNGGNYVRRSTAAAKEYEMEWGLRTRDQLRPVLDFADGLYGDDVYFCDPFAMDKNVLPSYWATPFMNAIDGPLVSMNGTVADTFDPQTLRPNLVDIVPQNGYPTRAGGIEGAHSIFIPVPMGYRFDFGYHDDVNLGGQISVQEVSSGVPVGPAFVPTTLAVGSSTRFNLSIDFSTANRGVRISTSPTLAPHALRYTGMMAQIVPIGKTASTGGFISGQGHSGLQFATQPTYYEYSAALDKVQASAKLVEVGAWRSI